MSVSPPCRQLRLAAHVRACRVGDQMIFLDLLRSKYIGVGGPHLDVLAATLLGAPTVDNVSAVLPDPALLGNWMRRLGAQQLLWDGPSADLESPSSRLLEPTASLVVDDDDVVLGADWRHLVGLWGSVLVTATWLRRRSLADIATRIVALRARHSHQVDGAVADAMATTAASFIRLRPFALTTHDRCLHDSLALIHFLATQALFPQWVIGVRVHPFGAHSWVQSGNVVLNDWPENVRRYEPILVV